MNEVWTDAVSAVAGGVLGVIFFVGLRWTIERGLRSSVPALWFLGSLVLRTSLVLAGFWLISRGHTDRMVLCLVGFFIVRVIATKAPGVTSPPTPLLGKERGARTEGASEPTGAITHAP